MMNNWILPTITTLILFGLWGFFSKLAVMNINAQSSFVYQTIGVLITGIIVLFFIGFKPTGDIKGISFGILTGLAYGLGCLFFFIAASRGKISTIVTLTALYPLITIGLSYLFLKEAISLRQFSGIILALAAIYLMSS